MEAKKLNVEMRQGDGKGAAGRLRSTGKIPAVIYGHTTPTSITVDAREFRTAFRRITQNTIVELHMPGGVHEVLVKDYQKDNLTGQIMHVDFYEFEKGKALRTRVPVRLIGNPVGVREGGILEHLLHRLDVECLPKDLPEEITLDINELALDRALHVSDLVLPRGSAPCRQLTRSSVSSPTARPRRKWPLPPWRERFPPRARRGLPPRKVRKPQKAPRSPRSPRRPKGKARKRISFCPSLLSGSGIRANATRAPGITSVSWWWMPWPPAWASTSRRNSSIHISSARGCTTVLPCTS